MSTHDIGVRWMGHATFVLTSPEGYRILIDPWLDGNPACPPDAKDPGRIDLILVTHGHQDHMGDAVPVAARTGAPIVATPEICDFLTSKGVRHTHEMNKGGTQTIGPVDVTMVHADHTSMITDGDRRIPGGEATGYIVGFSNGYSIWHMGDTALFGDMVLIAHTYHPDTALVPIGGHYTMSPQEAAHAIRMTGIKTVVPIHFGTFPVLNGTPKELSERCSDINGLQIVELKPGESVCL
ncbi:MAG TPA: metal-dependent hydrolase [Armatimonadota bacterium]|jgi:L-ascorbate metabolism protein UlaG (beta-lactamase superfamily)